MRKTNHAALLKALESRTYDALTIKRYGDLCYLMVKVGGKDQTFVNKLGVAPRYRHAWQIRAWLHERFDIAADSVPVEICR
jgi:hypothetical protein